MITSIQTILVDLVSFYTLFFCILCVINIVFSVKSPNRFMITLLVWAGGGPLLASDVGDKLNIFCP